MPSINQAALGDSLSHESAYTRLTGRRFRERRVSHLFIPEDDSRNIPLFPKMVTTQRGKEIEPNERKKTVQTEFVRPWKNVFSVFSFFPSVLVKSMVAE